MKYIHCIPHCLFKEKLFSITEDPLEENYDEEFANNNKVIILDMLQVIKIILKFRDIS